MIEVTERSEERWTAMIDRGAASPLSFGEKSYFFGTNIPGKPVRYLLNSAGRPKMFSVIAETVANDYDAFAFTRPAEPAGRQRLNGDRPLTRWRRVSRATPRSRASAAAAR